jgi:hypothetical protein
MGAFAFNSSGFPLFESQDRPINRQQVALEQLGCGSCGWGIHTGSAGDGPVSSYTDFLLRTVRSGFADVVPFDYEIRFTAEGSYAYDVSSGIIMPVPFELWNTGVDTPDDPGDDYRLIPYVIDWENDGWKLRDLDHEISGGGDDPETDWLFWRRPVDLSPGATGYDAWEAAALDLPLNDDGIPSSPDLSFYGVASDLELMANMVLVNWNGGEVEQGVYNQDVPEVGTVFRISTTNTLTTPRRRRRRARSPPSADSSRTPECAAPRTSRPRRSRPRVFQIV